jgi:hypothetical protein
MLEIFRQDIHLGAPYMLVLQNKEKEICAKITLHSSKRVAQDMVQFLISNMDRPRDLVQALRRIQWLAAWARKRIDGRRRAAEEILKQQQKWVAILESEMAIRKLA